MPLQNALLFNWGYNRTLVLTLSRAKCRRERVTTENAESAEGVSAEIKNPPIIPWKEEDSGVE